MVGPVRHHSEAVWSRRRRSLQAALVAAVTALALAILAVPPPAAGETQSDHGDLTYTNWTSVEGLPSNVVRSLAQTPDGFLWVGTLSGLSRFDGVEFENYDLSNVPGLDNPLILQLHCDEAGGLWIGVDYGAVYSLENGMFTASVESAADVFLGDAVLDSASVLAPDPALADSVASWGGRTWHIFDAMRDGDSRLCIATTHGFFRIDAPDLRSPPSVTLSDRVLPYDVTGEVRALLEDGNRNLWIASETKGLFRLAARIATPVPDMDGFPHWADQTPDAAKTSCFAVEYDPDAPGPFLLHTVNGPVPVLPPVAGSVPRWVSAARSGGVWVGFAEGLALYDASGRSSRSMTVVTAPGLWPPRKAVYEDADGRLWWHAGDALHCADASVRSEGALRSEVVVEGLPFDARVVARMPDGSLWLADKRSLARYERGRITSYTGEDGVPRGEIRNFWIDPVGRLWMTTRGNGLCCILDGEFRTCGVRNGLPDNTLGGIMEDGAGRLWINSNRGVFTVRVEALEDYASGRTDRVSARLVSHQEGNARAVRCSDGRFYFETIEGIFAVDPLRLPPTSPPPVAEATTVVTADSSWRCTGKVDLPLGQRNFRVSYTAPSLTGADRVQFRYRLHGIDDGWVEAGARREAAYSRIPPGEYIFEVVAANAERVWADAGDSVTITVPPRVHETAWFRLPVAALGLLLIAGAIVHRMRTQRARLVAVVAEVEKRRRAEQALHRLSQRLITAQEDERRRIAGELHDDINQRLALLTVRLQMLDDARVEELVEASRGISAEVQRISRALHPAKLEHVGLSKGLKSLCREVSRGGTVEVSFESNDSPEGMPMPVTLNLYRITQEALHNALKHSGSRRVSVVLAGSVEEVTLEVSDRGAGFDLARVNGEGLGFASMRERARAMGGRLNVESAPGAGTMIRLRIPRNGVTS